MSAALLPTTLALAAITKTLQHVPKITVANGGLLVDGQPFSPNGYCNHAHLRGHAKNGSRSFEIEVTEGFNAIFTYRGLPGEGEGRYGNESWPDTTAFLDRCAAVGVKVLFDFSQNVMLNVSEPPPLDAIRDAVTRYKNHPAILSWYLTDEPDGRKYPPQWVASAANLIHALDTSRPITMSFDTTNRKGGTWREYINYTDVVLADIYPVHGSSKPCTAANACNITREIGDSIRAAISATKKPLWFVPQAYGSQEAYQREPAAGEVRAMVYSAMLAGATGMFYFTREDTDWSPPVVKEYLHVGTAQPRASFMWSEVRRLALEMNEMAPWLMSGQTRPTVHASVAGVEAGAFMGVDGSVLVVAANMLGEPLGSVTLELTTMEADDVEWPASARVLFGSAYRVVPLSSNKGGGAAASADGESSSFRITDVIDAMSTRVYLVEPTPTATPPPEVTTDPKAANLIFNGELEFATSVGVPDGWMAQWGGDGAATQMHDSCVVAPTSTKDDAASRGHSLRLVTPAKGAGMRAWSFPVKAKLIVGAEYSLSFWARGGDDAQTLHAGFEALFGEEDAPCPGGTRGQCSYTPQPIALTLNKWKKFELVGKAKFQPDSTGYYGFAAMASFELVSTGTAWIDNVVLTLRNKGDMVESERDHAEARG